MPIVQLDKINLAYGQIPLLDNVKLQIDPKERIFLIGRNGAGKSTLLKIISQQLQPDSGQLWIQPNLRIATLNQELPDQNITVFDSVAQGLAKTGILLQQYHKLLHNKPTASSEQQSWLAKLEKLQHELEQNNGWLYEQKILAVLSEFQLSPETNIQDLSGGWKKRVTLAQAVVCDPELLLLDEPTNHLDLETINWLENYLLAFKKTIICISHDRTLVNKLATRIIEIDRGNLFSTTGNLKNFLEQKEKLLAEQERQNSVFDKKLAQEEVWIRQGIKARRTRDEGRVRALQAMRELRKKRREIMKKPGFNMSQGELSGQLVIEATNISYTIADKNIINNFSIRIIRGDKIGIIGPNGCGKTTLLNLLLDKIASQHGKIKHGTNLQIAYFDQLRAEIDHNLSVAENVGQGRNEININGKTKHIITYLGDFLFTPERARSPIRQLSGGEVNRVLLAKLFSLPANLLILDEPTNDLDIESLELLEEILISFKGTVLLVSHDRTFMDNIITQVLAFEEQGKITEYVGSYSDWIQHKAKTKIIPAKIATNTKDTPTKHQLSAPKNKKLNYNQQKELKNLPGKIEQLENTIISLNEKISQKDFYQQDQNTIEQTMQQLKSLQSELEQAYARWDELEN